MREWVNEWMSDWMKEWMNDLEFEKAIKGTMGLDQWRKRGEGMLVREEGVNREKM